ncbi:hypothetical protein QNI19_34570 [Cytophagaceae bacterium DM2B3-1]|uniref:DUF4253 domain-containing protein n=1 Tax=Xanthocytophaga flava TaxID=3048013 RepID=A0ABT7CWJ3_9BACT|nr:hypothetical protein [Xanthocytophaga flavus]MDJ1498119.1 hypothetical protein [Xanthocytophaga flavus]
MQNANITMFDRHCLDVFKLSEDETNFLMHCGLQDRPDLFISFYDSCTQWHYRFFEDEPYITIGESDSGAYYCIQVETREIWRLSYEENQEIKQYFNADLMCMNLSFQALDTFYESIALDHKSDIELFINELHKIDPKALQEELSLWNIFTWEWKMEFW